MSRERKVVYIGVGWNWLRIIYKNRLWLAVMDLRFRLTE
jgi:hypothetical protein